MKSTVIYEEIKDKDKEVDNKIKKKELKANFNNKKIEIVTKGQNSIIIILIFPLLKLVDIESDC